MSLLSLAHMAVLDLSPPEVVACAAAAGFGAVNLRLSPAQDHEPPFPMLGGSAMLLETLSRLNDSGLIVNDVEVVRIRPGIEVRSYEPMFEVAARLGARHVIAVSLDPEISRAAGAFAEICETAWPFGLTVDVEFMVFTEIRTLDQAIAFVGRSAPANAGILVDALHLHRSGSRPDDLVRLDPALMHFAQICDAPETMRQDLDYVSEARHARLPPGEGGLPLRAFFQALPVDCPISVEVPLAGSRRTWPALDRARLLHKTASDLMDAAGTPIEPT
jgi:sugar phosphate isomerase/epimerase